MKAIECLASWSLEKANFRNSFSGVFKMDSKGLFFQTERSFNNLYIGKIFGEKEGDGIVKKKEKRRLTLIGCEELFSSRTLIRNFKVDSIVDGIHLDENVAIKNAKIYFSNLKDWLESDFTKYFRPSSPTGENLHKTKNYSIKLSLPEDVVLLENEKLSIKIVYDNYYQSFIIDKKIEECEPYIEIIINDDNNYQNYLKEIKKLRDFLTFATKTKSYVKEISAITEDGIFFRQYFFVPNSLLGTYDFYMLFSFSLFQANKLHYGKWLKILDSAPLECDNFFLSLEQEHDHSFGSIKLKFIYLVQAIEAWKRCETDLMFDKYERGEIDRVLGNLNSQIVKKYKVKSFAGKLKKQTDLSQKIFKLIEEENKLLDLMYLRLDRKICDSIRDTRNYLTHLDPKNKNLLTDEGLFWAAALLQVIFEIKLMEEIGFSDKVILSRFSDTNNGNIYRSYFAGSHFSTFKAI